MANMPQNPPPGIHKPEVSPAPPGTDLQNLMRSALKLLNNLNELVILGIKDLQEEK